LVTYFGLKKIAEGRKAGRASKKRPPPPPPLGSRSGFATDVYLPMMAFMWVTLRMSARFCPHYAQEELEKSGGGVHSEIASSAPRHPH